MKHLLLIIIFLLLLSSGKLIAQKISFPPSVSSTDPSKRYSVIWKEATDSTEHFLLLKTIRTKHTRELLKFARHLDFFWSPDGNAFAVTDWGGSNFSDAWIGFPEDSTRKVSLNVNSIESKENDHVYFEILHWRNTKSLSIKVHGHGEHDPNGFEKYYECSLNGKIREIKKSRKD